MTLLRTDKKNQGGFTLMELVIVLIVYGLIILLVAKSYEQYINAQRTAITKENIQRMNNALTMFFLDNQRYPCPAARGIPADDPRYGHAASTSPVPANNDMSPPTPCTWADLGLAGAGCTAAGSQWPGICRSSGASPPNSGVIIGAVPVATLRRTSGLSISDRQSLDGWGGALTYAVTYTMTQNGGFTIDGGQIAAIDEFNNPTAGIEGDAHFALVAHGRDQKGTFTQTGANSAAACGNGTQMDDENCDNDATFRQALTVSEANTNQHFDDITYFGKFQSAELWSYIFNASGPTQHIRNLNTGNVGIGTNDPQARLDVVAFADPDDPTEIIPGAVRTNARVRANRVCMKSDPSRCIDLRDLTQWEGTCNGAAWNSSQVCNGTLVITRGLTCTGEREAMTGIANGQAICEEVDFAEQIKPKNCKPKWMVGIDENGNVICSP